MGGARRALCTFLLYLNEEGFTSLDQVTPPVIGRFLSWAVKSGRNTPAHSISFISVFFDWMIAEGRREHANPVVPRIHKKRKQVYLPRPIKTDDFDMTWRILR